MGSRIQTDWQSQKPFDLLQELNTDDHMHCIKRTLRLLKEWVEGPYSVFAPTITAHQQQLDEAQIRIQMVQEAIKGGRLSQACDLANEVTQEVKKLLRDIRIQVPCGAEFRELLEALEREGLSKWAVVKQADT